MVDAHESDYAHADLTERIIGCFFDVARELGYGFSERVALEERFVLGDPYDSLPLLRPVIDARRGPLSPVA